MQSRFATSPGNRFACWTLVLWLLVVGAATGCRTASSLGLPLALGTHGLLKEASQARNAGHIDLETSTELAKAALPAHRIEAGDVLVVEPNDFNCPIRFPSDQTVQQDGTIDLGSYGRVQVVGKTMQEIQGEIQLAVAQVETDKRQKIARLVSHRTSLGRTAENEPDVLDGADEDYGVTVRLVSRDSGVFYVLGDVNAPGAYPLNGHETVLDGLIAAGGLCDRANDRKIILTRPQLGDQAPSVLPVHYQRIVQLGDASTNYQILPGDRIYVPSLTFWEDVKQTLHLDNDAPRTK